MLNWYVMHTKPHKELFLFEQLYLNQIEAYLPLLKKNYRFERAGARPFFPGYLFVRVDITVSGVSLLLWIPGSKGIVCFGGEPASVSDPFIQQLKSKMELVNSDLKSKFRTYHAGDSVTITTGPFEGFEAIFDHYLPEQDRVQLLLKTLGDNNYHLEVPAGQLAV